MEDEKEGQVISGLEKAQTPGKLSLPRLLLVLTLLREWCCRCHELSYAYTTANAYSSHCDYIQRLPEDKPVQLAAPEEALCRLLHATVGDE